MTALHLLSGLLLQGMLASVITGFGCHLLLQAMLRIFPQGSADAKYMLCNACLLFTAAAFLRPFVLNVFTHSSPAPETTTEYTIAMTAQQSALQQVAKTTIATGYDFDQLLSGLLGLLQQHANLILAIYTCGLIFFMGRLAAGYNSMQRLRSKGLCVPDMMWQAQMSRTLARLGIRRPVRLAFSSVADAPCIVGWAKAIVLIPVALVTRLSPAQAEAVLLHELAHYRKYHYYINLAAEAIATLQFFNPFVWLIMRSGNRYREYACDAFAALHSRQVELAESLAIIAQQQAAFPALVLSIHSSKNQLLHRIQHLLYMKQTTSSSRIVMITFFVAVLVACCCYGTLRAVPAAKNPGRTDTLAAISRQMKAEENADYVIVEAIRDSFIRFDRHYDFTYIAGKVYIDSVLLPEPYQSRYKMMMVALSGNARYSMWSQRSDGISLAKVLDPRSSFRKKKVVPVVANYTNSAVHRADTVQHTAGSSKAVMDALIADKLIDTLTRIHLRYDGDMLYVNRKELTGNLRVKYEKLLRQYLDLNPAKPGQHSESWIYPEGVITPAMRTGNSLIQFPRQPGQRPYVEAVPTMSEYDAATVYTVLKHELTADQLADTSFTIHVVYTNKGIFVNDKKLQPAQHDKYEQLLTRQFGYCRPKQDSDLLDMTF